MKTIKLTESDLHRIVKRVIKENDSELKLESFKIELDVLDAGLENIPYSQQTGTSKIYIKTTKEAKTGYFGRDLLITILYTPKIENAKIISTPNDESKLPADKSLKVKNYSKGAQIKLPIATLTSGLERDGRFYLGTTEISCETTDGDSFELVLDLSSLYQNNN
jgi:hypothetical protein